MLSMSIVMKGNDMDRSNFSIDFELVNGLLLIEASVDSKLGHYILDTGCSFLAVHGKVSSIDVTLSSSEFVAKATEIEINNFKLGLINADQVDAVQFDMEPFNKLTHRKIDGLIGTDLFSQYNLMIDYEEGKIFFFSDQLDFAGYNLANYSITKSEISTYKSQAFMHIDIDGNTMNVLLDSGANISVIDSEWFSQLDQSQRVNLHSQITDDYTIQETRLGHTLVEDLSVIYRDLSSLQEQNSFDGILSLSSLNAAKIIFNIQRNQVIFFWSVDSLTSLD